MGMKQTRDEKSGWRWLWLPAFVAEGSRGYRTILQHWRDFVEQQQKRLGGWRGEKLFALLNR